MEASQLHSSLSKAQAEFKAVAFDSTNPFLKNKYASLGACIEATRPILAKHGLSITQQPVGDGTKIGVVTTLRHAGGESLSSEICLPLSDEKGKSQAQLAGSIITYLRRYSLAGVLGLYADEDTDGSHAAPAQQQPPQKPPQTRKNFTAADREKFIAAALKNGFTPEELKEYATKAAILLATEPITEWPLHKIPQTKEQFSALMEAVKGFVRDGDNIP